MKERKEEEVEHGCNSSFCSIKVIVDKTKKWKTSDNSLKDYYFGFPFYYRYTNLFVKVLVPSYGKTTTSKKQKQNKNLNKREYSLFK